MANMVDFEKYIENKCNVIQMGDITFSTCFYALNSKFDVSTYSMWINNFISITNKFNLVIYTDDYGVGLIDTMEKQNIKIIIKPIEEFYCYQYKDAWINNHKYNYLLNDKVCWEVNMLWSEKIHFVKQTIDNKYFDTTYYGWCDIGYFRNREYDTPIELLDDWGDANSFYNAHSSKIVYGRVNMDKNIMNEIFKISNNRLPNGLTVDKIPEHRTTLAGGFFILHKKNIEWWHETYYNKLILYFENKRVIKDDQIILVDCIFQNISRFTLLLEPDMRYDHWFMFQRYLSPKYMANA